MRRRRRSIRTTRVVLFVYLVVLATFQLSHFEYVPLRTTLFFSPASPLANSLYIVNGHQICPAQLYAQASTGVGIVDQKVQSPDNARTFYLPGRAARFQTSSVTQFSRAPPKA